MKQLNHVLGVQGEAIARQHLIEKGYQILNQNYTTKIGEIDIIAKKDNVIHFVEVKTRTSNSFGAPLEAIDYKKMQSIYHAGLFYIQQNKKYTKFQIDAIGITLDKDSIPNFNFIENVEI